TLQGQLLSAFSSFASRGLILSVAYRAAAGFLRVARGRGNAFGQRFLSDTPNGRFALFGVNEKRFCIGFALVLVPLPWQVRRQKTKLRGSWLLRTFRSANRFYNAPNAFKAAQSARSSGDRAIFRRG